MWIATRASFLSIVRHDSLPRTLLVRARRRDDIVNIWPEAVVVATPHADYGFRAAISEAAVIEAVTEQINEIGYTTDFKGGIEDPTRHAAYLNAWRAFLSLAHR
jgi:hypothetical protein